MEKIMADPDTRVLFWRLVVDYCQVFDSGFPINAQAYVLLARQEIGKRLLADMKQISPELTFRAEQEYALMQERENRLKNQLTEGESIYE